MSDNDITMARSIQKNISIPQEIAGDYEEITKRLKCLNSRIGLQDCAIAAIVMFLRLPDDSARLEAIEHSWGYLMEIAKAKLVEQDAGKTGSEAAAGAASAATRRQSQKAKKRPGRSA